MSVLHLCVVLFLTVVTVKGVAVNADCSQNACDAGLICQNNKCKRKVGATCGGDECVTNSICSAVPPRSCSCGDPFLTLVDKTICAKPAHVQCVLTSECVPNAECVHVTSSGVTRKLCQCKGDYTWSVDDRACNAARGLAASLLLVAFIFVTSRLL